MSLQTLERVGTPFDQLIGRASLDRRALLPEADPRDVAAADAERRRSAALQDVIDFAQNRLGFFPDAAQTRMLDPSIRRGIVNCTRQWGKSTTGAVKALYHALHTPNSLTVIVSLTLRQAGELVRKVEQFMLAIGLKPRGDGWNEVSIQFDNGARIVGLPHSGDTIRGFSKVSLIIVDEASRVPEETFAAVLPMMATTASVAQFWLLSTPNGCQGLFYNTWIADDPGNDWTRITVRATDCPRISQDYLNHERRSLIDATFRQEYMCEFTAEDNAIFELRELQVLLADWIQPLEFPGVESPLPGPAKPLTI